MLGWGVRPWRRNRPDALFLWGEVEQLRDLVRRLTDAYQAGADNLDLLREALAAVETMPPPPWDNPQ